MYCQASGVTKAHVFAKSFTSLFDEPNDTREHEVRHDYTDPETGEKRVLKRARTFALQARKVCGTCNGGWLNVLEGDVREMLDHFARDESITLNAWQQERLALWTFCAVLHGLELTPREDHRFASPELAHEVYARGCPPRGTQIWLGANTHGEMAWFGSHSLRLQPPIDDSRAFGSSISFGYGVMHTIFHGSPDRRLQFRYDLHRTLRQIWPVRGGVAWPPALRIPLRDLSPVALEINSFGAWVADEPVDGPTAAEMRTT